MPSPLTRLAALVPPAFPAPPPGTADWVAGHVTGVAAGMAAAAAIYVIVTARRTGGPSCA